MIIKNVLYLLYFIIKTDYNDLRASYHCANKRGYSSLKLFFGMIISTLRYGSSFVDYFNFRFYLKNHEDRKAYATMGYMYEIHRLLNDKTHVHEIDDKDKFRINFKSFCSKSYVFGRTEIESACAELENRIGKRIVIKDPKSTAGKSIKIVDVKEENGEIRLTNIQAKKYVQQIIEKSGSFYFEDYIDQHSEINKISSSAVNTIRIISIIDNFGNVKIIGSVFRISVNSPIDNYSAGNIAAEIDPDTGVVLTGGIRKRASCDEYHDYHEVSKQKIKGFSIPYWVECINMVKKAALVVPEVRTVGWDVAITEQGPIIIEGNSKWNKDTWQIPAGYGKKTLLIIF